MYGRVTATALNIRHRPELNAKRLGQLTENTIVDIIGSDANWYEIRFNDQTAYAANRYIQPIKDTHELQGIIRAGQLNVRQQPNLTSPIIGILSTEQIVDVLAQHNRWLEIPFNDSTGFIAAKYVDLTAANKQQQGIIKAAKLNVRAKPNAQSAILGLLSQNTTVTIKATLNGWHEIIFNGATAYISARHVQSQDHTDDVHHPSPRVMVDVITDNNDPIDINDPLQTALTPSHTFDVSGSAQMQKVARTWNKYGGLLGALSEQNQFDPGCAVAVLCVESSGDGFMKSNQDRMVIRFENHKFWRYWGQHHRDVFQQHFKLNLNHKPWLGHAWRPNNNEPWQKFHGNQAKEWQVLEFARQLDEAAALQSISMGAPQIMGFHYQKIGYPNVQDMFHAFNSDIRHHILGLFDFLSNRMMQNLRDKDFVSFAAQYNGSGQKQKYGKWIDEHYQAFQQIAQ